LLIVVALAAMVVACSGASAPGGGSTAPSVAASPPASPGASGSGGPVDSAEEAAARIAATDPQFEGIHPKDPNVIGQCCWWQAAPTDTGWQVAITKGWGDCPAGCINHHTWTFAVARDGTVKLLAESGDEGPPASGTN
jgi:hypothetical protein